MLKMLAHHVQCPLEINIIESEGQEAAWSCNITLVKKYRHDAHLLNEEDEDEDLADYGPLGPWSEANLEECAFATLHSWEKDLICEKIKRCQLAALNPSQDYHNFIQGPFDFDEDACEVGFSPNIVRVDVSAWLESSAS